MPDAAQTDRTVKIMSVATFALLLACIPVALHADEVADRQRVMYRDLREMVWLQYREVARTGTGETLDLSSGEYVTLAGEKFTVSAGVRVLVRLPEDGDYCVQVSNEHGDRSQWHCLGDGEPPTDPSPEPQDVSL